VQVQEVRARIEKALAERHLTLEVRRLRESYHRDLERQVHDLSRKNQAMFLAQVQMAVTMLEAKDPYTRGHSGRVAEYAVGTARNLGIGPSLIEQIRLGGELHDIGKIGTRDAVLHKAGPLSAEEFAEIRRHTVDGEAMLSVLRIDHPEVLHIVRWHHERLDGTGFPDGLVGTQIPMAARIVSVVDAFDAMTTTRAYRENQSVEESVAELRRCAGHQFDPDVIEAFLTAFPDAAALPL
jgi:HD-GYP domain-containing protein (c-di-GMP phosphodiesterase class II)